MLYRQVIVDGVVREYIAKVPAGHAYYFDELENLGRYGFPLVCMAHGHGQSPLSLMAQWPIHLLADANGTPTEKFVTLYLFGTALSTDATGGPDRYWEALGDALPWRPNDVKYVQACIADLEQLLRSDLQARRTYRGVLLDPRRHVNQMPDHWAALWVMAGSIGGQRYDGQSLLTLNAPNPQGKKAISLMIHHGEDDTKIPPGAGVGALTFDGDTLGALMNPPWVMSLAAAQSVTGKVYSLATAVNEYVTYNRSIYPAFPIAPTFSAAATSRLGNAPPGGTLNHQLYEQAAPNLVTVGFRWDHEMNHTSYNAGTPPTTNWYFTATTVWQFFRDRPQLP